MQLKRRKFIQLGSAAGAALTVGSQFGMKAKAAALMELKQTGSASPTGKKNQEIPYTCLTCNIEDGGIAYVEDGRIRRLEGNPNHPGNRGKLCAKGNAGHLHVYDPTRILNPLKRIGPRGSGKWKRISWDEALSEVAGKIQGAMDIDPMSIIFQYGRNRTHGLVYRFMNALGSGTVNNHTSICECNKKVAMEHAWGPDIETPDFAHTKYILNFGSNLAEAAYFHNPYIQRLIDGKVENKAKLVTFDPRMTNTGAISDEWVPLKPATDGIVALAMCNVILQEGLADTEFIRKYTNVTAHQLAEHLKQFSPEFAEKESGVSADTIRRIAIEFATAGPATTYTYRGSSMHQNGVYTEKATMMLNVVTGNIEKRGGFNLPRGLGFGGGPGPHPPKPPHSILKYPPEYPLASHHVSHHVSHSILEGRQKINVFMLYCHNPLYTQPDGDTWKELLSSEKHIPYSVSFSINMDSSTEYADIILPDTTFLERWDPESMPSSALGWVGLRQPVIKPLGNAKAFRDTIYELAQKIDPDGKRGVKKYFSYGSAESYVKNQLEATPGLKAAGGFKLLKKYGVWPFYDKKKEDNFKFGAHEEALSESDLAGTTLEGRTLMKGGKSVGLMVDGKAVRGFGTPSRTFQVNVPEWEHYGFEPMPHYEPIEDHKRMKSDELLLSTYKPNVHTQSRTPNLKWLQELHHRNPAWINSETAKARGIGDDELIRITSPIGYMVTKARVTEAIHPQVVAIATSSGMTNKATVGNYGGTKDPDIVQNTWWDDTGVHPNQIIPVSTDPIGGGMGWFDTVITVTKAKAGDKYGDTHSDRGAARKAFEKALSKATKVRDSGDAHNTTAKTNVRDERHTEVGGVFGTTAKLRDFEDPHNTTA